MAVEAGLRGLLGTRAEEAATRRSAMTLIALSRALEDPPCVQSARVAGSLRVCLRLPDLRRQIDGNLSSELSSSIIGRTARFLE